MRYARFGRQTAFFIILLAAVEVAFGVLLVGVGYRVSLSLRAAARAAFQANVAINEVAVRAAAIAQPKGVTLLFVGDVMLARGVTFYTEREGNGDFRFPFMRASSTLRAADLTVGNLEGPLSDRGRNQGSAYSLRAPSRAIAGLSDAGFDLVSLANNHIWDWGTDALSDTLAALDGAGIRHAGAGMNEAEANRPVEVEVNGNRFAFLSWTNLYPEGLEAAGENPGVSRFREGEALARVRELSDAGNIVVVLFHWGDEYRTSANDEQRRVARALIDAGAALVVGHHPHVAEEVERYRSGWIAYSLGNFVFDQGFSEETMRGLALSVTVANGSVTNVERLSTRMNEHFQPAFDAVQ